MERMERGLRVERALSTPDPEGTIALASEIDQQRDCDVFVKVTGKDVLVMNNNMATEGKNLTRRESAESRQSGSLGEKDACNMPTTILRRKRSPSQNGASENGFDDVSVVRRRSASVLEVRERAQDRLKEELASAQQALQLKDHEFQRLSEIHAKMETELEDLTASLFEEANKMVQDANIKRMQSEKLLNESEAKLTERSVQNNLLRSQIDVLQAEVTALKSLVLTSTPAAPNRHLHPQVRRDVIPPLILQLQINAPNGHHAEDAKKKSVFSRGHRRSTSHHQFSQGGAAEAMATAPPPAEPPEIDPVAFRDFLAWRVNPALDEKHPFLSRIVREEVDPCLTFASAELSAKVASCVRNNQIMIEPLPEKNPFPKYAFHRCMMLSDVTRLCSLTQTTRVCRHRVRLGEGAAEWSFISPLARCRITSVCNFYTYIRYITLGLVGADENVVYWEVVRLRKEMCMARLGYV